MWSLLATVLVPPRCLSMNNVGSYQSVWHSIQSIVETHAVKYLSTFKITSTQRKSSKRQLNAN
ncbi:hypothetical protein F2Q68_00040359 [Brassica cretica]|uniref:Secreted protein n=1 Tax=Brassica cretica TaxID=69181 RepID=A0A8S9MRQ9_BRACR|nr:hypothetical protein F2Q68_00040359 [Brassica cretica]